MSTRVSGSALVVFTAAAIVGCSTARSAQPDTGEQAVSVRVTPAEELTRPSVSTASGVVQAQSVVDVAFQVPGKVIAVGPDEGSTVRAGELLAQIDPTDYRLGLEQAAAQAEHATSDRERYRPLLAAGSIAASDFERIASGARQATAVADLARKRLADTRLVAPLSGIVARRAIERGASAGVGQPVFTLMDVDPVRVRVGVPESEIGSVRVGQQAEVELPALAGQTFAGRVTLVGIAADPTTRTYAVEVSVPNPARRLKVGMVAEARVQVDRWTRAISVPAGAVVRDADGVTLLYVLDGRAHRAEARRVELGAARDDAIEIIRGVRAGELVLVAGQQRVRDGSRVSVASQVREADGRLGGAQ
jgi:membrane fusion protein, multidrug efflux system